MVSGPSEHKPVCPSPPPHDSLVRRVSARAWTRRECRRGALRAGLLPECRLRHASQENTSANPPWACEGGWLGVTRARCPCCSVSCCLPSPTPLTRERLSSPEPGFCLLLALGCCFGHVGIPGCKWQLLAALPRAVGVAVDRLSVFQERAASPAPASAVSPWRRALPTGGSSPAPGSCPHPVAGGGSAQHPGRGCCSVAGPLSVLPVSPTPASPPIRCKR